VTLHGSSGQVLVDWLGANQYVVPTSLQPTFDAYASEGFDFIALRLRADCDAKAMQPVRVVMQGNSTSLPLRMVAAGVDEGAQVGITLYVVAEGLLLPQNFPVAPIDYSLLTVTSTGATSNYEDLAQAAMATSNGAAWVIEYAGPAQFALGGTVSSPFNPGLADAYFGACQLLSGGTFGTTPPCPDAGSIVLDAGDDAQADAAPAPSGPCAGLDDLDVALTGLDRGSTWVTRLRSSLTPALLGKADLELGPPTTTATQVTNVHDAVAYSDLPVHGTACETAPARESAGSWLLVVATALGTSALLRRRRGP